MVKTVVFGMSFLCPNFPPTMKEKIFILDAYFIFVTINRHVLREKNVIRLTIDCLVEAWVETSYQSLRLPRGVNHDPA